MTTGHPTFYLTLYLTGVHFQGELHHVSDVISKKLSINQSELYDRL